MATIPTQNAVPSEAPRDLKFNSGKIDEFVTSLEHEYKDRFGRCHMTIEGMRWIFDQLMERFKVDINHAIIAAGYIPMDSFQQGAEITKRNEILRDETTGEYYRWDGDLPKTVPAGSTPESAGGVGMGAWVSVGDASLRGELNRGDGILVGTNHRGDLAIDLDAIDRRPDGYKNNIQDVLSNGNDVEINKNFTISKSITPDKNQVISGAGGEISISTAFAAVYTDARKEGKNLDKTKIIGLSINGVVVPDGEAAYGVFYRDIDYPVVSGLYASNFTGALINLHCTNSYIHNIRATKTVYHPSLVAGGYGVLVAESDQTIIDGVFFDANEGDDGRHLLYLSTSDGSGATNGNTNTIATNMIAKYKDKDDRNFWGINVRRSNRAVVNNFIIDGANGGLAYNPEQGDISQHITSNGVINVLKYKDDVGVYGIGHLYHGTNKIIGTLDTTLNINVDLKNRSLTGKDCVAHSISGINCMFSNSIVKVPRVSSPIIINPGASHILIDGILDYSEGGTTSLAPFIAFSGDEGSCSDITVRGIKTHRPMFARLHAVIDLTVDFPRNARIVISSGSVTKSDDYEIIKSTDIIDNGVIIKFNNHVTQKSIDSVLIRDQGPTHSIIAEYITGKAVRISTYNLKGDPISPAASNIIMHVTLIS
ncbi:hypothetical protein [Morganella sp. GD04133]|uniref:tail fiber/spike domain-containing protein n=1 Tax=Morganella sp. GD04133 TaxID=2975435 RepID=UPI002446BC2C|nr:hypothetical protein [Morganella sp. GD04133]MDH0356607.1 hypothetical protein [Morganella sp. GD04133]